MKPGQRPAAAGWNRGSGKTRQWLTDHINYQHDYCLIWPFSLTRGYGRFIFHGEAYYAHRFMCELAHGPAPSPAHQASHSCGRGAEGCVNPNHLAWKSSSENQLDKRVHGTAYRAGKRWKLKPAQVLEIRTLKGQKTQGEIAEMYGVGRQNIGAIMTGKSWPNLEPTTCPNEKQPGSP